MSSNSDKLSFPVLPVAHWWNLRKQFRRSIPGAVTPNYLSTVLSMQENSAATNIVPSLKLIGLIDDEGNTNQQAARRFRDNDQYKDYCEELLTSIYPPELLSAFPDASVDRERVVNWFQNATGVGQSGAGRMAGFFVVLRAGDATAGDESTPTPKSTPQAKSRPRQRSGSGSGGAADRVNNDKDKADREPDSHESPSLNINVQVHISADATPDQIDKIFESMAKHIYNR